MTDKDPCCSLIGSPIPPIRDTEAYLQYLAHQIGCLSTHLCEMNNGLHDRLDKLEKDLHNAERGTT